MERLLEKHPSKPFNPLLANAFFRAGYIESWGRGIEKIARECQLHDIAPPVYNASMSGLMVTFRANPLHLKAALGKAAEGLGEKLGETRAAIVRAMRDNPKVSQKRLAQMLNLSTTAVEKNVRYLQSSGYVKRVGHAKGGRWEVLRVEDE